MDKSPEQEAMGLKLDQIERQAWDAMAHYRFFEACAYIEFWAVLHKQSLLKRQNPFQEVAALARRKCQEKLREVK